MDLSNKTLAWILVIAIIISLGGTIMSFNKIGAISRYGLVGLVPGQVVLTISSNISCTISSNISFGS